MPPRSPQRPAPTSRRKPTFPLSNIVMIALFATVISMLFYQPLASIVSARQIKTSDFYGLLDTGKLKTVTLIGKTRLQGEVKEPADESLKELKIPSGHFTVQLGEATDGHASIQSKLREQKVPFDAHEDHGEWVGSAFGALLMVGLLAALVYTVALPRLRDPMGNPAASNFARSPAKRYDKPKSRITFADVAAMEGAKRELSEIVEFLRAPEKFHKLGAQVPRGVLLVGPPGTGKTLLARAVAGEATVPFFSMNGSEFIQMFVGVGATRVRDLFKTARESAPCLVFIDEIDAVGRMRGAGVGGGSDEREQTLNQILSEMDGFSPTETVIVIAATNRPDVLDSALLRPGRFDRHVTVDRSNASGRLAILQIHTKNKPLADGLDLAAIAKAMTGMTGADLRMLANEAALLAASEGKSKLERIDFERAADRVLIGPKREELLTVDDKRRIAYHEAGHALAAWMLPDTERPLKVSIIPRGRSLGVNFFSQPEDRYHHRRDYFKSRLAVLMGGRAADRLLYGQPDAGAEMDIKQATKLARMMVAHWGMSDRLGPMSFRIGEEHVFLGKELQEPRDFSEGTAQAIDEEVQALLREADERALELLRDHRAELDVIVEGLMEREELDRAAIDVLLAPFGVAASVDGVAEVMAPQLGAVLESVTGQGGIASGLTAAIPSRKMPNEHVAG